MSDANVLVDSKVSASGEARSLAIEKFNGQVKRAYSTDPNLMQYFDLQEVTGTNVISNKYMGVTQVQALAPGKDVRGSEVQFDKNSLVVDTTLISRNLVGMLDDVQDDIMTKGKLAEEQVTALKTLENRMLLQQCIYGATTNTQKLRAKPRVKGHGFSIVHGIESAEALANPLKLMAGIEWVLEDMIMQNVDVNKLTIFMPWIEFNCLRDAERIVDARYNTASGSTVTGFVLKSYNVPVVPCNDFPNKKRDHQDIDGENQEHHLLSNANNNYRYDVNTTKGQQACAALIMGREGLMVGRSIALQGKIWFNDNNKTWYIDTWMSEGAIPDRWEHLGALLRVNNSGADNISESEFASMVQTFSTEKTSLNARYDRKVLPVKNVGAVGAGYSMERSAEPLDPAAFAAAVAIALEQLVKPNALKAKPQTEEAK